MNTETVYSNAGVILRAGLQKNGVEFLGQFDSLEEYLKSNKCDTTVICQLLLFLRTSNIIRYIPQTHTGISLIDINNIISCAEATSGLCRDTIKKILVTVLYGLSLPTSLTTIEIPTESGRRYKDAVLEPVDKYEQKLSTISKAIKERDLDTLAPLFPELNRMADNGNAEALYQKGLCYFYGVGIEENDNEAQKYFEMAAHNGSVKANAALGDYCFQADIPNYTQAFAYYTMLGSIANSKERQKRVKIIVEEKHLNSKLIVANAILLVFLIVFDVFMINGAFSAYGTHHAFWGIVSIVLAVAGFSLSVLNYIKLRYNSIMWATPLIFVLDMLCVLFALL